MLNSMQYNQLLGKINRGSNDLVEQLVTRCVHEVLTIKECTCKLDGYFLAFYLCKFITLDMKVELFNKAADEFFKKLNEQYASM